MKRASPASLVLFALLMLPACSSDNGGGGPKATRTWYYERELRQDASLQAEPHNIVLLDVRRTEGAAGSVRHSIPYHYSEGGQYTYCIDATDPYLTRMSLTDKAGYEVLSVERGAGCVSRSIQAGNYTMLVEHDGGSAPAAGTVAFIHQMNGRPASAAAVASGNGGTTSSLFPEYPAYVGLRVVGGQYDGGYLVRSHYQFQSSYAAGDTALQVSLLDSATAADFRAFDHLFSFESASSADAVARSNGDSNLSGPYNFHSYLEDKTKTLFSWAPALCDNPHNEDPALCIASQNQIGASCFLPAFAGHSQPELTVSAEDHGNGLFAVWEEGTYVSPLSSIYAAPENAMVYLTALAKAATNPTLFQADPHFRFYDDPSQLPVPPMPQQGEVALYEGANYTGNSFFINGSFADSSLVTLETIRSIRLGFDTTLQVFSQKNFQDLIETVGSDQASLATPLNGAGIQSIQVFDSKTVLLSAKQCEYCNLAAVDLHSLDLSSVDLKYAALYGANLSYSNLTSANLCEASLNGNEQSQSKAASLAGAYLKNTNLGYADLGGADFSNANFYSQAGDACVPTSCAVPSTCASAYAATMTATNFNGAYLNGVDMSAAKVMGAQFSNSMVLGVRFTDSDVSLDPNTGTATDFDGAFIGGADFTGAKAAGANFSSAYVDFSSNGGCMLLELGGAHTEFAGYWNTKGDTPCVMFVYSNPTATPTTDRTNTCPDGSSGSCGQAQWTDPMTPMNQSSQPASSCDDPHPLCDISQIDFNW